MGFNQKKEEEFGNLILENTVVGKTLEHFGYKIYNLETANKNFRDILGLDDIKDIQVVFPLEDENGELVDTFELISKENYWNAFYEPIWCKIRDVEKVRALEWLFEDFKYKYNLDVNLTYIPHAKSSVKSEVCGSSFSVARTKKGKKGQEDIVTLKNYIYINLDDIHSDLPYDIVDTIIHELTHARQKKFSKTIQKDKKNNYYTLSQSREFNYTKFDYSEMLITEGDKYALYRNSESEKNAELQGLKYLLKFKNMNEKKYGKNLLIDKHLEEYKHDLFVNKYEPNYGILLNHIKNFKGQTDVLMKLMMLKVYYTQQKEKLLQQMTNLLWDIDTEKEKLGSNGRENMLIKQNIQNIEDKRNDIKNQYQEVSKKILNISKVFEETMAKGKLPNGFSKQEFDVLNIKEEDNKYYLPKKLRDDEIKYTEEINELIK